MLLTPIQKRICEQVLNVIESGLVYGDYGALTIFRDGLNFGKGRVAQVTYGCKQFTEFGGNLTKLFQMYCEHPKGTELIASKLADHIPLIGKVDDSKESTILAKIIDTRFFKSLRDDPVMKECQDKLFEQNYFIPAMSWATKHGFILPLSALVIYDSFIHSGSISSMLRNKFSELPPSEGGNEKQWITEYTQARLEWLNHTYPGTAYRQRNYIWQINQGNWNLEMLPIMIHWKFWLGGKDSKPADHGIAVSGIPQ